MEIHKYLFGGATRQMVYKSLDAGSLRARAIANNLANVESPGYRRKEVAFEEQLQKAFDIRIKGKTTNDSHFEISRDRELQKVRPKSFLPGDPTLPGEVNNVDIDLEGAKLAENQILYQFAVRFAGFGGLNSAITGQPKG